jgi:hypothetical protein
MGDDKRADAILPPSVKRPPMAPGQRELLAALRTKIKVDEAVLSPLPASYEETAVTVLQPPVPPPLPARIKAAQGNLGENVSLTTSLNLNSYFARKLKEKEQEVVVDIAGEFSKIGECSFDGK